MASSPTWIASPDQLGSSPPNVVHAMIEALIEWCDRKDGDPDLEPNGDELDFTGAEDDFVGDTSRKGDLFAGPGCPASDVGEDDDPGGGNVTDEPHDADDEDARGDPAWPERSDQTRFPGAHPHLGRWQVGEDDEDDDRDSCLAADDDPRRRFSDGRPGDREDIEEDDHSGGAVDDAGEGEQMLGDVPNPAAIALEPDIFTGKRQRLGFTNLQPSFVDNGGGARDAFTGRVQYRHGRTGDLRFDRPWRAGDALPSAPPEPKPQRGPAPNPRFKWMDPDEMPDVYGLTCVGTCLEPVFSNGVALAFTKLGRPEPGDFVAVLFKEGVAPPGEPQGWVKRLVSAGPGGLTFFDMAPGSDISPFVTVEMLNPPKRFVIPATKIAAIHKCLGQCVEMPGGGLALPKHLVPAGAQL